MSWKEETIGGKSWSSEGDSSSEWLSEGSPEKATVTAREYAQQAENSAYFAGQAKEEVCAARDVVLSARLEVSTNKAAVLEAVEAAKGEVVKAQNSAIEAGRYTEETKATLEEAVAIVPSVTVTATDNGVVVTAKDIHGETVAEVLNGLPGERGPQGIQGERGQTGSQGPAGERGPAGEAGYTPVRGVDYWTEADVASMVDTVVDRVVTESWVFTLADGTEVVKEICAR